MTEAPQIDRRAALAALCSSPAILAALASGTHGDDALTDEAQRQLRRLRMEDDVPSGTYLGVVLDLPYEFRTRNWGGGSCVHASNVTLLRYMGLFELADWWRRTYSGGEYDDRLVQRLEKSGVRYAFAHGGQDNNRDGRDDGEQFIEWCVRTRRGCGIFYKPVHSINLIGLDAQFAYLLDNNATDYPERVGHPERVERKAFFRNWHGFGGFAWTIVVNPPPPQPFVKS
jgi:hypothetical protein